MVITIALEVLAALMIIYAIYCFISFLIRFIALRIKIKRMVSDNVTVQYTRLFYKVLLGKKGETDFVVSTGQGKTAVSIISFLSTRGRWNIERTRSDRYFIEARINSKMFYNLYVNSGTEPEHSKEYRRERRFQRCKLHLLPPEEMECDKYVLLMFPRPKLLTYTDARLDYLNSGSAIRGYTIMYASDFFEHINSQKSDK